MSTTSASLIPRARAVRGEEQLPKLVLLIPQVRSSIYNPRARSKQTNNMLKVSVLISAHWCFG